MTRVPTVVLIANIIAPYRVPTLRELARRVDLHVLFSAPTEANRKWSVPDDLPFSYSVVGGRSFSSPERTRYPSPRILRELYRHRPDVIISGGYSFPTIYAAMYAAARRAAVVLYSEGTDTAEIGLTRAQILARGVLCRRVRAAVSSSAAGVERFVNLGMAREDCFIAPYALDLEGRPVARPGTAPTTRLLCAGQLIERKGVRELLAAFAGLDRRDYRLTVAGSGPEEKALKRLAGEFGIDDRVEFIGFVDQDRLPDLYAGHDVFLFPTLRDTFGVVVLEAAAASLPVLASPHAGATGDFVVHGETGWIVDPCDKRALVAALQRVFADRNRWEQMGQAGSALVARASPSASATEYERAVRYAISS